MTINKVCGSGLKAIHLATQAIIAGDADIIVAGGMENMSQAPYLLQNAREGFRMGDQKVVDSMIQMDYGVHLMIIIWVLQQKIYVINIILLEKNKMQFSARSQERAADAIEEGTFEDEIVPVEIPQRKGDPIVFDTDEYPKAGSTAEKLANFVQHLKKMDL